MTSTSGERPQESSPAGTPAKRTLPLKRGVRRGDVLLMVAKLDPELAKPEQKTQPRDTPKDKTPATDPGGTKKGATTGAPCGPQAPVPEKNVTGDDGATGQGTKDGKSQGLEGEGSRDPQTKGQRECESQSTEGQGTRSPVQGGGKKGQVGAVEKERGGPPKKMEKGNGSKGSGAEVRPLEPPVPIRKWGGSLGRRSKWDSPQSKNRESESQRRGEKMGKAEPRGQQQEAPGSMGKAEGPQKKPVTPEKCQEQPEVAVETQSPQESCKAPAGIPTEGTSAEAARREDQPESRVQVAKEPCVHAEEEVDIVESQAEGHVASIPQPHLERPSMQTPVEEKQVLQDPGSGGQSGDSDQVMGCGLWSLRDGKDMP